MRRLALFIALLLSPQIAPSATSSTPSFTAVDGSAIETAGSVPLTVQKSIVAKSYSKITITTADGTAKANVDYRPVSTSVTVGNRQLTITVPLAIIARPGYQGDRALSFKIAVTRNGTVARSTATVTIRESEAPPQTAWAFCSNENQTCFITGTANVRYGANGTWATKQVTGSIGCNNQVYGDPLPNVFKHCETDGQVASSPSPEPTPTPTPLPGPTPVPSTCAVISVPADQQPLPVADRSCVAAKACPDYRAQLPGWAGPPPVLVAGARYHLVRGDLWGSGEAGADHVVAWPEGSPSFPGFAGGAYFDADCF